MPSALWLATHSSKMHITGTDGVIRGPENLFGETLRGDTTEQVVLGSFTYGTISGSLGTDKAWEVARGLHLMGMSFLPKPSLRCSIYSRVSGVRASFVHRSHGMRGWEFGA